MHRAMRYRLELEPTSKARRGYAIACEGLANNLHALRINIFEHALSLFGPRQARTHFQKVLQ